MLAFPQALRRSDGAVTTTLPPAYLRWLPHSKATPPCMWLYPGPATVHLVSTCEHIRRNRSIGRENLLPRIAVRCPLARSQDYLQGM